MYIYRWKSKYKGVLKLKITFCGLLLLNILKNVSGYFFFQEDYAPLSIMLYKLEIGKHQSNPIMLRHKYSKVFEEFCKYVLRDASMTPKINPFGWHHSENFRFISSTQYWKRILKFTITNTECFVLNDLLQNTTIASYTCTFTSKKS